MKINWRKVLISTAAIAIGVQTCAGLPLRFASADDVVSDEYAIEFYSGESSVSYYIDKNSNLYVSGNNGGGEFGNGTSGGVVYTPTKIMEGVRTVADGKSGFAIVLKTDGTLYGWGKNQYSQLGQGTPFNSDTETNCILSPVKIDLPGTSAVSAIAAGDHFTVVLTENGEVYTCGRAGDGQTGIAGLELSRKTVVGSLTKIDGTYFNGEKIAAIDAAENTGFALSENGNLYVWGANDKGILGNGSTDENEIYETPVKLEFSEKIAEVSAETMTVLVRTESGNVYGWGDNSVGQLGSAEATEVVSGTPVQIDKYYDADGVETEIEVESVLCGGRTNFVLATDGRIFAFGAAGNGQAGCNLKNESYLGHPCVSESNVVLPMQIRFYQAVSLENGSDEALAAYKDKVAVDLSTEADVKIQRLIGSIGDRTFVADTEGNTWSWGSNLYAMACSGDAFDCTVPVRSTLFRKENYDKTYKEKNYILKPAIVMSCVVVFAVGYFVWAEIKIRKDKKRFAEEEKVRGKKE